MAQQAYASWITVLYELFVRTNEIHLMELSGDSRGAHELLADYVGQRGFYWLPYTLAKLHEYEQNRDRYPTFSQFLPVMMKVFDETEPVVVGGTMICVAPKR